MMRWTRWLACLPLAAAALCHAQSYPARPVRVIVPYEPGGGVDMVVRPVMDHVGSASHQPVVIENRSGGGGSIGTAVGAKAAPDGYTLVIGSSTTVSVNPVLMHVQYDAQKDLIPITMLGVQPRLAVTSASLPYKTLRDLVEDAKAKPNQLVYSSSGNGGPGHLGGELFKQRAGIQMLHVPYRGEPPAILAVLGGQAQFTMPSIASVLAHVKSGKLRALAISSTERIAALPETPTFAEQGYKDMNLSSWIGLFAPAGTPPAIVDFLQKQARGALEDPAVLKTLSGSYVEPVGSDPRAFAAFVAQDQERNRQLITALKLKVD